MATPEKCPRCGSTDFAEHDCGPDSYDDDITYESYSCKKCGLWYDGWRDDWLIQKDGTNVEYWNNAEDAAPYGEYRSQ